MQEAKANEFVLVYDPDTGNFVLERLSSMSRLSATRSSRTNTLNGSTNISTPIPMRPRSKSDDDIPTISLDAPTTSSSHQDIIQDDPDDPPVPALITPRLPPVSPMQSRHPRNKRPDPESSSDDDDSDISIQVPTKPVPTAGPDDDVSDEDLDDLANELESSLENRPESSSEEGADSDIPGPPTKSKGPDFGNVPRSGGPISMSRFAGGRRREEEEESSSSDDDDD